MTDDRTGNLCFAHVQAILNLETSFKTSKIVHGFKSTAGFVHKGVELFVCIAPMDVKTSPRWIKIFLNLVVSQKKFVRQQKGFYD